MKSSSDNMKVKNRVIVLEACGCFIHLPDDPDKKKWSTTSLTPEGNLVNKYGQVF